MDTQPVDTIATYNDTEKRKPLPHAFTRENAREMSAKAAEARKRARQHREELNALPPSHPAVVSNGFTMLQRNMLRERLRRISDMIATERDPAALDRLCSAFAKLAEQERISDARPLPGAFRPVPERRPRSSPASLGPVD
jgi:hypothetical protein